ncbi:hypothetical protein [uncultured Tessaracoccus sp.]|uniref:hypothetical protein n=1 Tax=uncultured Tessaracoccus sp. TaxID=905023 RepID=UPI002637DEFD|nr:hypothetical protein [uncultured Tessaracoccus sp.]
MTRRINWREAGIYAAATGLTLIEPRSLRGWQKWAYWGAVSAVTGLSAFPEEDDDGLYRAIMPGYRAALGVATAGVTFGLREPLLAADAWCADTVRSWGAKHPRRWMAAATGALSVVALALSSKRAAQLDAFGEPEDAELDPIPLEPRVREIVETMLAQCDGWGADELRAQLATAQQFAFDEDEPVTLVVQPDAPRTLVSDYEFPVVGRSTVDGREVIVRLVIEDGILTLLECVDDEWIAHPLPDELRFGVENPATASEERDDD